MLQVGFFEPVKSLLAVTHTGIQSGEVKTVGGGSFRVGLEKVQLSPPVAALPRVCKCTTKSLLPRGGMLRRVAKSESYLMPFFDGIWEIALLFVGLLQEESSKKGIGVQFLHFVKALERLIILVRREKRSRCQRNEHGRERIEADGAVHLRH